MSRGGMGINTIINRHSPAINKHWGSSLSAGKASPTLRSDKVSVTLPFNCPFEEGESARVRPGSGSLCKSLILAMQVSWWKRSCPFL